MTSDLQIWDFICLLGHDSSFLICTLSIKLYFLCLMNEQLYFLWILCQIIKCHTAHTFMNVMRPNCIEMGVTCLEVYLNTSTDFFYLNATTAFFNIRVLFIYIYPIILSNLVICEVISLAKAVRTVGCLSLKGISYFLLLHYFWR